MKCVRCKEQPVADDPGATRFCPDCRSELAGRAKERYGKARYNQIANGLHANHATPLTVREHRLEKQGGICGRCRGEVGPTQPLSLEDVFEERKPLAVHKEKGHCRFVCESCGYEGADRREVRAGVCTYCRRIEGWISEGRTSVERVRLWASSPRADRLARG